MINLFIPSKNRASQLRFLLESISENMPSFFNEIKILYKHTNEDFKKGYEKLKEEKILPNIIWQEETNFVQDFLKCLESCEADFICGMVDDCVVYKRVSASNKIVEALLGDDEVFCFSFRLGLNTEIQNYLTRKNDRLTKYQENSIGVKWDYSFYNSLSGYGYPISLDGHIYRSSELLELSKRLEFNSLREWEGNMVYSCKIDETTKKHMASFKQSILFSIPCNCVQKESMPSGELYPYSEEELNKKYLNNEVISFWGMQCSFQNIQCTHNEVELFFSNI